jgi:hypothetical protein
MRVGFHVPQRQSSVPVEKVEAAKKFSAIHFIKRSNFVENCMARAEAKPLKAAKSPTASKPVPTTTGQSNK